MADETTRGRREFRKGDRVLIEHPKEPCRFLRYISRSHVAVTCPDGPDGQRIEAPRDRVWHADDEGIVERAAHKIEGR